MVEGNPNVTLHTLHDDLTSGFADLKITIVAGFRSLPSREAADEMIRLLRESNRLQEERLTSLDIRIREQHLETHPALQSIARIQRDLVETQHDLVDGQRALVDGQQALVDGQQGLVASQRAMLESHAGLSDDIRRLIARIDALIERRDNGSPPAS